MAQESILETDNGIIITNNVELSTVGSLSGNSKPQCDVVDIQTNTNTRRHNISISSIDSNASSSPNTSGSESDTDDDTKPDCTVIQNLANEYLANYSTDQDGVLPMPMDNSPAHNIASMTIKNSTNVRVGNTQEFHAPVTIQQFMVDEDRKRWTEVKNGIVNDGFVQSFNDATVATGDNQKGT